MVSHYVIMEYCVLRPRSDSRNWPRSSEWRQTVQGRWLSLQKLSHFNCLEMEAVYLTMKHFLPNLSNKNVLIQIDNTTVAQYLNRQGGTKSLKPRHLTWKLWSLALENNICLKAVRIAGKKNVLADYLSRQSVKQTEWSLNKTVVDRIFYHWGHRLMDLFATFQNKKTQLFCWCHVIWSLVLLFML